jgi:hypothetical protein
MRDWPRRAAATTHCNIDENMSDTFASSAGNKEEEDDDESILLCDLGTSKGVLNEENAYIQDNKLADKVEGSYGEIMEIVQQLASAAQTKKCGVLTLGALHTMLQAMKGGSDCLSASLLEMAQQYGSTFSRPEKQDCMVQEENTHNKENHVLSLTMAVIINPPQAVKQNNKAQQK